MGSTPGVWEIRNYALREGVRETFIEYFEDRFLDSQEDVGIRVLGQFRLRGAPDRFVWIRGFPDMDARRRSLEAFYGGAYWADHKGPANEMMIAWDRVWLLRPVSDPEAILAGGRRAGASGAEADPGRVVVDAFRVAPSDRRSVIERSVIETRADAGNRARTWFVAETTPNDFPDLPVIQDEDLLVSLTVGPAGFEPERPADVEERLVLTPTPRSIVRFR